MMTSERTLDLRQELIEARHRDEPSLFKDFVEANTLAECQASTQLEGLIELGIARDNLSIYYKRELVKPHSRDEFDAIMADKDHFGFVIGSMTICSTAVRGLNKALNAVYHPTRTVLGGYVSKAGGAVLPLHSDKEPVLAIQVYGQKEFDLRFGRTASMTTVTLAPGDGLFIPAEMFHRTRALSDSLQICAMLLDDDE
jgi:hypothetical protein